MKTITGIYYNGQLKLERPLKTKKPVKVTLTYEEDSKTSLALSDFSFLESQEQLKDYKGSFSDEVIEERRKAVHPKAGCMKGIFKMSPDFNEPLDDFKEYV